MIKISTLCNNEIFNEYNFNRIKYNARHSEIRLRSNRIKWDSFDFHVNNFCNCQHVTSELLLLAMGVAYSWMPTMLNIYIRDLRQLRPAVKAVNYLRTINSFESFTEENNQKKIINSLRILKSTVNNSMVGVSKVLHLFAPKTIPIVDSRVGRAWKEFFSECKVYKRFFPSTGLQESDYLKYWCVLLYWKDQVRKCSIRGIEKQFFIYGGSLEK